VTSKADSIYCSGLLPVLSLEAIEQARGKPLPDRADPSDDPEIMLVKKRDRERFISWVHGLPRPLGEVAMALVDGDSQAAIAKRLKLSEPAITKRVRRILAIGYVELGDLRRSPILT
jgi:DNA-binding NarL/FixJ family response regulator